MSNNVASRVPAVARNADGRLEAFGLGPDRAVWHVWQTSSGPGPATWSDWDSLGGNFTSEPVVCANFDGRLEVFARGANNALWHAAQAAPSRGPWSAWESLGGTLTSDPAVAANVDGRLEVFARSADNKLWHIWQIAPPGRRVGHFQGGDDATQRLSQWATQPWSQWSPLLSGADFEITSNPVAALWLGFDPRLFVWARITPQGPLPGYSIMYASQDLPNRRHALRWFFAIAPITDETTSDFAAVYHERVELFARRADNTLWHYYPFLSLTDMAGRSLGGAITSDPAAVVNADGRVEVFARGVNNALWHIGQTARGVDGPWGGWESLGGTLTSDPAAVVDAAGHLDVFARSTDNALWHIRQTFPSSGPWSKWQSLGGTLIDDPLHV